MLSVVFTIGIFVGSLSGLNYSYSALVSIPSSVGGAASPPSPRAVSALKLFSLIRTCSFSSGYFSA